jgi:hypothetical protein
MFFNGIYFTLRKVAINPTAGWGFTGNYGTANAGTFFT